ncbi:MAG: spheroidene monooxygenase [Solirubrobacterales bacterium]
MIFSIDIAEVGIPHGLRLLTRRPRPEEVEGLQYAETVFTAPLGDSLLPAPNFGTVALLAAWEDDSSLDRFASHPLARQLADGWQVRMAPLRVSGAWPGLDGLPERPLPVDDEEPVAVLTLGRLMPWRARPFLRAAAPAEADAVAEPGLLASTGFGRLPSLVSTFTLWSTAAAMRDYAYRQGGSHRAAVATDRERAFHRHSAFIRFRPYATRGKWDGADPLAAAALTV